MFAYCNNNPINFEDSSGCSLIPSTVVMNDSTGGDTHIGTTNSSDLQKINNYNKRAPVADLKKYINNTDEDKVIQAKNIAFYKGVLYVKVSMMDDAAFSMGAVFIGPNATGSDIVRHEYGHILHMREIGFLKYTTFVAIPSAFYYHKYGVDEHYYSLPWEYAAEIRGRVNRKNGKYQYKGYAEELYEDYFSFIE